MYRRFSANMSVAALFFDFLFAATSFLLATLWRPFFQFSFIKSQPIIISFPPVLYFLLPLLWVVLGMFFSLYDGRRYVKKGQEELILLATTFFAIVAQAGVLYFSYREISRFLVVLAGIVTLVLNLLWRSFYRTLRQKQTPLVKTRRVLILGAGKNGKKFREQLDKNPNLNLEFVGFLDDDPQKIGQEQVLDSTKTVRKCIQELLIDDLVITFPNRAQQRLFEIVKEVYDLPIHIWIVPDYFSLSLYNTAKTADFAGIPMLDLRAPALDEYQRMTKRIFDLTLIILSLPFVAPVFGLIALLIKIDSPGQVFFCQDRMGENGKLFKMIKFRTMIPDAEAKKHLVETTDADGNLIHKVKDDPRITKIGRILRKTSLDEIPQIINVLRGEMSLIGPRPEQPYLVAKYETWQRTRFAVPQGMTGWWQINGRSDKPMHLNTQDDLYYVQNYSLWLDLYILCKTFLVVINHKGAY